MNVFTSLLQSNTSHFTSLSKIGNGSKGWLFLRELFYPSTNQFISILNILTKRRERGELYLLICPGAILSKSQRGNLILLSIRTCTTALTIVQTSVWILNIFFLNYNLEQIGKIDAQNRKLKFKYVI